MTNKMVFGPNEVEEVPRGPSGLLTSICRGQNLGPYDDQPSKADGLSCR
jgi:hypothetical protein